VLNGLCLSQKALFHRHLLQSVFCSFHEVTFCLPIRPCPFSEIIGIMPYVTSLGIDFQVPLAKPSDKGQIKGFAIYRDAGFQDVGSLPSLMLLLIASIFRCFARYDNVTSGEPSLIIIWTVIRLLNTTVHVESRRRFCKTLNTSATPCSPECVAIKMCSMYLCNNMGQLTDRGRGLVGGPYFDLGGAAWRN
jgi:hypothetical protein